MSLLLFHLINKGLYVLPLLFFLWDFSRHGISPRFESFSLRDKGATALIPAKEICKVDIIYALEQRLSYPFRVFSNVLYIKHNLLLLKRQYIGIELPLKAAGKTLRYRGANRLQLLIDRAQRQQV